MLDGRALQRQPCVRATASCGVATPNASAAAAEITNSSIGKLSGASGLLDIVHSLQPDLPVIPIPQRAALQAALGWSASGSSTGDGDPDDRRYLVAAALMSLLAVAAARRPVLVLVDDLQWVDQETVAALRFAGRRLHDPGRLRAGRSRHRIRRSMGRRPAAPAHGSRCGVGASDARRRRGRAARRPARTHDRRQPARAHRGGAVHVARATSGVGPLPDALPLVDRLMAALARSLTGLSAAARRAVVLAAASTDTASAPIVAALQLEESAPSRPSPRRSTPG